MLAVHFDGWSNVWSGSVFSLVDLLLPVSYVTAVCCLSLLLVKLKFRGPM